MKYCIVILHYLLNDTTCECIDSILSFKTYKDYKIVIVNNDTKENIELKQKYGDLVDILNTNKRLSFSKANNLGYAYSKEKYNPEFIIIINNDIIFNDSNFLNKINELFIRYNFDVLGPDIQDINGNHTSPIQIGKPTFREMLELIIKDSYRNSRIYIMVRNFLHRISKKPLSKLRKKIERENIVDCIFDVELQGSCLIYSKNYIYNHNCAFYPINNYYGEELLLKLVVDKENGIMIYSPSLKVIHKSKVVTKKSNKNVTKFRKNNMLKSRIKYLTLYYRKKIKI